MDNTHLNKCHSGVASLVVAFAFMLMFAPALAATPAGLVLIAEDSVIVGRGEIHVEDPVFEGDTLRTGPEGSLTVLFSDESVLSLSSGAEAIIEEYSTGKPGKCLIRVTKGKYSFTPGEILAQGGSQLVVSEQEEGETASADEEVGGSQKDEDGDGREGEESTAESGTEPDEQKEPGGSEESGGGGGDSGEETATVEESGDEGGSGSQEGDSSVSSETSTADADDDDPDFVDSGCKGEECGDAALAGATGGTTWLEGFLANAESQGASQAQLGALSTAYDSGGMNAAENTFLNLGFSMEGLSLGSSMKGMQGQMQGLQNQALGAAALGATSEIAGSIAKDVSAGIAAEAAAGMSSGVAANVAADISGKAATGAAMSGRAVAGGVAMKGAMRGAQGATIQGAARGAQGVVATMQGAAGGAAMQGAAGAAMQGAGQQQNLQNQFQGMQH